MPRILNRMSPEEFAEHNARIEKNRAEVAARMADEKLKQERRVESWKRHGLVLPEVKDPYADKISKIRYVKSLDRYKNTLLCEETYLKIFEQEKEKMEKRRGAFLAYIYTQKDCDAFRFLIGLRLYMKYYYKFDIKNSDVIFVSGNRYTHTELLKTWYVGEQMYNGVVMTYTDVLLHTKKKIQEFVKKLPENFGVFYCEVLKDPNFYAFYKKHNLDMYKVYKFLLASQNVNFEINRDQSVYINIRDYELPYMVNNFLQNFRYSHLHDFTMIVQKENVVKVKYCKPSFVVKATGSYRVVIATATPCTLKDAPLLSTAKPFYPKLFNRERILSNLNLPRNPINRKRYIEKVDFIYNKNKYKVKESFENIITPALLRINYENTLKRRRLQKTADVEYKYTISIYDLIYKNNKMFKPSPFSLDNRRNYIIC